MILCLESLRLEIPLFFTRCSCVVSAPSTYSVNTDSQCIAPSIGVQLERDESNVGYDLCSLAKRVSRKPKAVVRLSSGVDGEGVVEETARFLGRNVIAYVEVFGLRGEHLEALIADGVIFCFNKERVAELGEENVVKIYLVPTGAFSTS